MKNKDYSKIAFYLGIILLIGFAIIYPQSRLRIVDTQYFESEVSVARIHFHNYSTLGGRYNRSKPAHYYLEIKNKDKYELIHLSAVDFSKLDLRDKKVQIAYNVYTLQNGDKEVCLASISAGKTIEFETNIMSEEKKIFVKCTRLYSKKDYENSIKPVVSSRDIRSKIEITNFEE